MEPARGGLIIFGHETLAQHNYQTSQSLDEFSWCVSLHEYSRSRGDEDDAGGLDIGPADDLVSAMISTAIVPLICKLVEAGALDPYSTVDTRHMINVAEQVEAFIGQDNHKFQVISVL
jgi:GC-rich sequence DNA-binding factor